MSVRLLCAWNILFILFIYFIAGYNVYTYDHQSQGLSGRWLNETQSTWVYNWDDYVNDFHYYVSFVIRGESNSQLPIYLIAHSMGGLISSIAMSRYQNLITRAVLLAPMLRMKCGTKALNYRFPLPQIVTHWASWFGLLFVALLHFLFYIYVYYRLFSWAGLGTMHSLGFFKERPMDALPHDVFTSDVDQLKNMELLRQRYPILLSTCITNDWIKHSLEAQQEFTKFYGLIRTNTLVLQAGKDRFVYARAMREFVQKAAFARMFILPKSLHEIIFETVERRTACVDTILEFFGQYSDDVSLVSCKQPFLEYDPSKSDFSLVQALVRGSGMLVASVGMLLGLSMMVGIGTPGSRGRVSQVPWISWGVLDKK